MDRRVFLVLALLVIIATFGGVYYAHEIYRTTITVTTISTQEKDGYYVLYVKEVVNYGPFGGEKPLAQAPVWLYVGTSEHHTFYAMNLTNGSGIAVFYVKPGTYYILFNTFKMGYQVQVNGSVMVTLNVAYLDKRFVP